MLRFFAEALAVHIAVLDACNRRRPLYTPSESFTGDCAHPAVVYC